MINFGFRDQNKYVDIKISFTMKLNTEVRVIRYIFRVIRCGCLSYLKWGIILNWQYWYIKVPISVLVNVWTNPDNLCLEAENVEIVIIVTYV